LDTKTKMRQGASGKKYKALFSVILLYLLFIISDDDGKIQPEDLESYRAELSVWVEDNLEDLREEQNNRKKVIRDVCDKYKVNQHVPSGQQPKAILPLKLENEDYAFLKGINWQYIYHAKHQSIVWCKVPKAGSSTWTYNFLKLAGQTTNSTKIHKLLRDYYPKVEDRKALKEDFKFMVVRHPFERLLSAYRDKLEDLSRDMDAREGYYHNMYGKHIVAQYRDKSDRNLTNVLEPTWREFVEYIITTPANKFDEHWMPIWMLCSPCIVRYNVISKMETFAEDTQFTLEEAGLDNILEVEWKHRTGTGGSSDTIMDYYSQLTTAEVAELFHKYRLDFELYEYNPEPYFEIAKQDNP